MGIKALDPEGWIMFGEDAAHQLAERRRLLDERPDDVLAALPGSEAAVEELLALVLDHLETSTPRTVARDTDLDRVTAAARRCRCRCWG